MNNMLKKKKIQMYEAIQQTTTTSNQCNKTLIQYMCTDGIDSIQKAHQTCNITLYHWNIESAENYIE